MRAIEVTACGRNVRRPIEALTKMPLAEKVGKIHEPEPLWIRALVTQARLKLAGAARRPKVSVDPGCLGGSTGWWLAQQGITGVVPAKAKLGMRADARTQAVAGEEITPAGGRRSATGRVKRLGVNG